MTLEQEWGLGKISKIDNMGDENSVHQSESYLKVKQIEHAHKFSEH